ncbi:Phenylalanine hydroxylase [Fasciola hepatica]|uniref:Phenylalanine hydroxylase n=1 Tax=Fasciola hepatica TaxID=6192 RepID=A0A4E0R7P1_FASHE|nr:Phenylalanine hydroxylase [Fasciola hepatica]
MSVRPKLLANSEHETVHSIVLTCRGNSDATLEQKSIIREIILLIDNSKIELCHLETRDDQPLVDKNKETGFSCILLLRCTLDVLELTKAQMKLIKGVTQVITDGKDFADTVDTTNVKIPKHVSDLDECRHLLLKFQPELQTDHPGFTDLNYRKRRQEIAQLAFDYRYGNPLPEVEYTAEEIQTWRVVYSKLSSLHSTRACAEYMNGLRLLEKYGGFSPDNIAQLRTVSNFLERTSGFCLRPVAGLVDPRDFLAHLAFRVFPCTQYIRHHSRPLHTPEPDCIHELLGHMPLLTSRKFADFCQQLGLLSLGSSNEEIEQIATLYWFTVEFGLCQEGGEIRALGAGLLSSYGELENAFSDRAEKRPFIPNMTAIQPYDDVGYQPIYFVCESIVRMKKQFRQYISSLGKHILPHYDPYTRTIEMLTPAKMRETVVKEIKQLLHFIHNGDSVEQTIGIASHLGDSKD